MKIKIINPNTSTEMTDSIYQSAIEVKQPSTEIVCVNPLRGPECIEGTSDEIIASYHLLNELKESELEDEYDAYIVACFGDPAIDGLRELTNKPVIGIAEAAIQMSIFIGGNFSIVSILPRVRKHLKELVMRCGAENRLASIITPNLSVLGFHNDSINSERILIESAKQAVTEDYAEVIILGCAGMSGLEKKVSNKTGVPVIDSVAAAVKVAEGLVQMGLNTSKINTYQNPTVKRFK